MTRRPAPVLGVQALLAAALLCGGWAMAGLPEGRQAFDKGQFTQARLELAPLAEDGQADAQAIMAEMLLRGQGGARDELKARDYLLKAAEAGNLRAMHQLGQLYVAGTLVTRDAAKGVDLVRQAADKGHAPAQTLLGAWVSSGSQGFAKDEVLALQWFTQAASQKDPGALYWMGYYAENGLGGMAQDTLVALDWFKKSAEAGNGDAMAAVGRIYAIGKSVTADGREAQRWLHRGVVAGSASAYIWMGSVHEFGRGGVLRNPTLAYAWYLAVPPRASAPVLKAASDAKERLARILAPSEIEAAEKQSRTLALQSALGAALRDGALPAVPGAATGRSGVYGSGVAVSSRGDVVTNEHVIRNCTRIRVQPLARTARLVASDAKNDLALLKLDDPGLVPVRLRAGRGLRLGDDVVAIGYPLRGLLASGPIVTMGIVNALSGANNDTSAFQLSATVQPGSSGGPIFDRSGLLVGVVRARLTSSTSANAQNVNFGINLPAVMAFLDAQGVDYQTADPVASPPSVGDMVATAQKSALQIECY